MIDSTGSTSSAAPATRTQSGALGNPGGVLGKDQFLKMLVAQLRHQDPMNPMNSDQMAAQMAQFSSVEQLININEGIAAQRGDQSALLGAMQSSAAVGTIGREVTAIGDQIAIGPRGTATVDVEVAGLGGTGTLTIYDQAGRQVGTRDLGTIGAGAQTISLGDATKGLAEGVYRYEVTVSDASSASVPVRHYMRGVVDGVRATANGIMLTAGALTIPYATVLQIQT